MEEKEIIEYLKNNKNEGRIISFMPDEVKRWCEEHLKELLVWQSHRWYKFDACDICTDDAVTLPDDYKVKEESKGEWVEFKIDNDGTFYINGLTVLWFNWQHVLSDGYGKKNGYTAFGGWQYNGDSGWFTTPCIKKCDKESFWHYIDGEAKPAIPAKIRFWKG